MTANDNRVDLDKATKDMAPEAAELFKHAVLMARGMK